MGGAEHSDLCTHRRGELHSHMSEPAQAYDSHLISWLAAEMAQRRVSCDPSAHQWSGFCWIKTLRDPQHITLVNNNLPGIASLGPGLRGLVEAVESERHTFLTEHLMTCPALRADAARIDNAAHPNRVTLAETSCARTMRCYPANNLVARHEREVGSAPVIAHLVQVAMANAAVENLDLNIVWPRLAPLDLERFKRCVSCKGTVCRNLHRHGQRRNSRRHRRWLNSARSKCLPQASPAGQFPPRIREDGLRKGRRA